MRRLLYFIPVAVFAVLAGLFLFQLRAGRDASILPSVMIDQPAPDFVLPAVAGVDMPGFATTDLQGQVTIVNIFASWCIPCLAEHPLITRLAEDGFNVYGINHRDTDTAAARWLKRNGNPYAAVGADREARVSLDWGVTGVPETFIIDADGSIRFKHSGPITPDILERDFLPILTQLTSPEGS